MVEHQIMVLRWPTVIGAPAEEPNRTEAPSIEQGIPMEEVPKVDRGEGNRVRNVPQTTSAPGGGDSGVVMTALA
ncbi:hypothetical protein ACLOJK_023385 [Asimina triloba]